MNRSMVRIWVAWCDRDHQRVFGARNGCRIWGHWGPCMKCLMTRAQGRWILGSRQPPIPVHRSITPKWRN